MIKGGLALAAAALLAGCSSSGGGGSSASEARRYVTAHADEARTVQVDVQLVQAEIGLLSNDDNACYKLETDTSNAHDELDRIRDDFLIDAHLDSSVGNQESEMYDAVNELKNSMAAINTYCDDPTPSHANSAVTQFQRGVAYWDESARLLWRAADMAKPPLI